MCQIPFEKVELKPLFYLKWHALLTLCGKELRLQTSFVSVPTFPRFPRLLDRTVNSTTSLVDPNSWSLREKKRHKLWFPLNEDKSQTCQHWKMLKLCYAYTCFNKTVGLVLIDEPQPLWLCVLLEKQQCHKKTPPCPALKRLIEVLPKKFVDIQFWAFNASHTAAKSKPKRPSLIPAILWVGVKIE